MSKPKLVMVGNGMAGVRTVEELFKIKFNQNNNKKMKDLPFRMLIYNIFVIIKLLKIMLLKLLFNKDNKFKIG